MCGYRFDGQALVSAGQRRINGMLIMFLFGLIAFALGVRQRLSGELTVDTLETHTVSA